MPQVRIGIGVGVRARGEQVDPSDFVNGLADLLQRHGIVAARFDGLVRFSAGDQAPGAPRRLVAMVLRGLRASFTASEVLIDTTDGCLRVAVAGRDLDDQPRSVEFQTFDPTDPDYDKDDDEGYCLVDERHVPVFKALESVRLVDDRLRLRLIRAAAETWEIPSTTLNIKLRISAQDRHRLREGLRRIFDTSTADPAPDLHL